MTDTNPLRARFRAPGIKWSSTSLTARVRRYISADGPRRVLVLDFALPEGGRAAVEIRPSAALDLTNLIVDTLEEDAVLNSSPSSTLPPNVRQPHHRGGQHDRRTAARTG